MERVDSFIFPHSVLDKSAHFSKIPSNIDSVLSDSEGSIDPTRFRITSLTFSCMSAGTFLGQSLVKLLIPNWRVSITATA